MNKIRLSLQKLRYEFINDGADPIETDMFLEISMQRIEVWQHFERYALQVWDTGRRRYGAQTICHQIRWHMEIERGVGEFDINNNWIAYYARLFMYQYPEAREVEFFEVRKFKEKNNGPGIDRRDEKSNVGGRIKEILPSIQSRDEARAGLDAKNQQQSLFPR